MAFVCVEIIYNEMHLIAGNYTYYIVARKVILLLFSTFHWQTTIPIEQLVLVEIYQGCCDTLSNKTFPRTKLYQTVIKINFVKIYIYICILDDALFILYSFE